jgi:hypothetical protein
MANGHKKQQGSRSMTRKIILAASTVALVAISGQAFAYSVVAPKRAQQVTFEEQVPRAFNAFDRTSAPSAGEPGTYRYQGGPKSN